MYLSILSKIKSNLINIKWILGKMGFYIGK